MAKNIPKTYEADIKANEKSEIVKYSIKELADAAPFLLGVKSECVIAAMAMTGTIEATKAEAIDIVKEFMKKEVK